MIIFDIETNDKELVKDSCILEVAAYNTETGEIFNRRGRGRIKPGAKAVNRLDYRDLGYLTERELLSDFINFIGDESLCGYWLPFDAVFLAQRCEELGLDFNTNRHYFDICIEFRSKPINKKSGGSLTERYEFVTGFKCNVAHSAIVDVHMTDTILTYYTEHYGPLSPLSYSDILQKSKLVK